MREFSLAERLFFLMCNRKKRAWGDRRKLLPKKERRQVQEKEWQKFWERIGEAPPDFEDRWVVDYGCGYGYDGLFMLEGGTKYLYSLDIKAIRLENSRELHESCGFTNVTYIDNNKVEELVGKIDAGTVDIVFCRNAMEHVASPQGVLESIYTLLRPGGVAYIGFSGIFKSPYGAHISSKCKVPWVHLLFSENTILSVFKKEYGLSPETRHYIDIPGSGVNKMSYYRYVKMLRSFDWKIEALYANRFMKKPLFMKAMNFVKAVVPFKCAKELFIINTYAKLVKPSL